MEHGSTSLRGAVRGLLAASAIPFCFVSLPLFLSALNGHWHSGPTAAGTISAALALLGASFLVELGYTVLIGGPIWIFLKSRRRESGASYMKCGAVGGALVAATKYGRRGIYSSSDVVICVIYIAVGASGGLLFWLVARERDGNYFYTGALPSRREDLTPL